MSGGFSFPPPPPPPPKAGQPPGSLPGYTNDHTNRGRGRGRGEPSGGRSQRGRGQHSGRGSYAHNHEAHGQHGGSPNGSYQNDNAPAGTRGYPNISTHHSPPNTISWDRSPQPGYSHAPQANAAVSDGRVGSSQASSPPRTVAGHKRKLDALRPPQHERTKRPGPQTAPAVPSFGASLLPPKPPLPVKQSAHQAATTVPKPAARSLGLTPGSNDLRYSSSDSEDEDDEVDEEAMHAELGTKLTFEHNGVVMSLASGADLAAWKKERQKKWPTRARMTERDQERWRVGEERKRLLASANSLQRSAESKSRPTTRRGQGFGAKAAEDFVQRSAGLRDGCSADDGAKPQTELDKTKRQIEEQTRRLDELRRRVTESEARNRAARAQQEARADFQPDDDALAEAANDKLPDVSLEAGEHDSPEPEAADHDELEDGPLDNSSLEISSVVSSDTSSDADSDDEPPEEMASKPRPGTILGVERPVCRYFITSGYCRDGDACRYRHDLPPHGSNTTSIVQPGNQRPPPLKREPRPPPIESVTEKKSIFQRLLEQEQDGEDKLALQVIKYLGKAGFFKPVSVGDSD